jgi:hypothetical protein
LVARRNGITLLLGVAAGIGVVSLLLRPIPQPLSYHHFADQRAWLGIPNFSDVISNLPFAVVGLCGLWFLLRLQSNCMPTHFVDARERWPYALVFLGLLLTAFGSAYYHLAPDNARLVWDRLPMTLAFMALVAAMIVERISVRAGLYLLAPLLIVGALSVVLWHLSEMSGAGDLRFYAAVQAFAVLMLPLAVLLFPPRYTRSGDLWLVVGFYVLAKVLEELDRVIFGLVHVVSGHTLKHLSAALAGYWILRMLAKRRAFSVQC